MILSKASFIRLHVALSLFVVTGAELVRGADEAAILSQARAAVDEGRFRDAEQLLRSHITEGDAPAIDPLPVELEIIRRIRLDYALTSEDLLAELRSTIPDVTTEDCDRWREQHDLQHRLIDGEIRYFKRAPTNLFRFCEEARTRRAATNRPAPAGWKFSIPDHLHRIVQMGQRWVRMH